MSQVKNRRENIFIDKPPVKILSLEDLPVATTETAGLVSVGEGLSVSETGELSATTTGVEVVTLWEGETPADAGDLSTVLALEDDITNYNFVVVNLVGASGKNLVTNVISVSDIVVGSGDDSQIAMIGFQSTGTTNVVAFKFTDSDELTVTATGTGVYFKSIKAY